MIGNTKNDLSGNEAKVDFDALVYTARVAVGSCVENISRYKDKIRLACSGTETDVTSLYMSARYLQNESEKLTICADTLAVLEGSKERDKFTLIRSKKE